MTVIQNKYRSYCESKRFKQSLTSDCKSTAVDSSELEMNETLKSVESLPSSSKISRKDSSQNISGLKRTYSQTTQNQAARKIQQFMLTAKNK